jgi:UPF0755 protein
MSIREDLANEIIGILLVVSSFATAWILLDYHRFTIKPLTGESVAVDYEIKAGESISSLSVDFAERGWIRHALYLKFYARQNNLQDIKLGHYQLMPQQTISEVLQKFVTADVELQKITIIEGWTSAQMLEAIRQHPDIRQTLTGKSLQEIMALLGNDQVHPEGQFLPDTYAFASDTTDLEILQTAHKALNDTLHNLWQQRQQDLPLNAPYDALILASIIEKETGVAAERPLIAGVFITRLRKNMKLQTDPTVIYGMGDQYKGNIRKKDLLKDTPYNTYVHKGLTPSPISLAGADAILAATQPDEQGYLYFVAKGDGTHYFSKTLQEHNDAVRKYQLKK